MQDIHPIITPHNAVKVGHLVQLGWYNGMIYPKHMRWHPHKPLLAMAYFDGGTDVAATAIWSAAGKRMFHTSDSTRHPIHEYSAGWSYDGRFFATGLHTITIYNDRQEKLREIPGHILEWSPRTYALATRASGDIAIIDIRQARMIGLEDSADTVLGWASTLRWQDNGGWAGVGAAEIKHWDSNGACIARHAFPHGARRAGRTAAIRKWMWSPDGQRLVYATIDQVLVVDPRGKQLFAVSADTSACFMEAVVWHSRRHELAIIDGWDVQRWDLDGKHMATLKGRHYGIVALGWSPDGRILATGSWDSTICLWSDDGTLLHTLFTWERRNSIGAVFGLKWSADGRYLAAALRDCSVHLYAIID